MWWVVAALCPSGWLLKVPGYEHAVQMDDRGDFRLQSIWNDTMDRVLKDQPIHMKGPFPSGADLSRSCRLSTATQPAARHPVQDPDH